MTEFMGEDFLLDTDCAKKLFHEFAENMPMVLQKPKKGCTDS